MSTGDHRVSRPSSTCFCKKSATRKRCSCYAATTRSPAWTRHTAFSWVASFHLCSKSSLKCQGLVGRNNWPLQRPTAVAGVPGRVQLHAPGGRNRQPDLLLARRHQSGPEALWPAAPHRQAHDHPERWAAQRPALERPQPRRHQGLGGERARLAHVRPRRGSSWPKLYFPLPHALTSPRLQVNMFCRIFDIDVVIRAHEVQNDGYLLECENHLITVFSAINYTNQFNNAAAVVCIDPKLHVSIKVLKPHFIPGMATAWTIATLLGVNVPFGTNSQSFVLMLITFVH